MTKSKELLTIVESEKVSSLPQNFYARLKYDLDRPHSFTKGSVVRFADKNDHALLASGQRAFTVSEGSQSISLLLDLESDFDHEIVPDSEVSYQASLTGHDATEYVRLVSAVTNSLSSLRQFINKSKSAKAGSIQTTLNSIYKQFTDKF